MHKQIATKVSEVKEREKKSCLNVACCLKALEVVNKVLYKYDPFTILLDNLMRTW